MAAIQACGVRHTDVDYRGGGTNDEFPFLLGHEAAGLAESIAEGVTNVAPGDFVVLNWRAVCGECRACPRVEPQYCINTFDAVGFPQMWKQAFYARDLAGTLALVGVPHPAAPVPDIPLLVVFGHGGPHWAWALDHHRRGGRRTGPLTVPTEFCPPWLCLSAAVRDE